MSLEALVQNRQSCRNFNLDKKVNKEDILSCIEAARLAPSACNSQPWHFTVCTGNLAKEVSYTTQSMGMNKFATNVPGFIVISEESYNTTAAIGSKVKGQDYRSIDIGIATAQLTLRAEELGISTCILGWFDEKKLRKMLSIKNRIRLVIAMGYASDGDKIRNKVRKSVDEITTFIE